MKSLEGILKCRVFFTTNTLIYWIISIIVISQFSFVKDSDSYWTIVLVYGLALIFWTLAGVFAFGFYKEENQGKDTRNTMITFTCVDSM